VKRNIYFFILIYLFIGCGGVSKYYHLYPTIPAKEGSFKMSRRVVGVAEVKLADYLDKAEILTQKDGTLVDIHEKENWAGDFAKNIQMVISQNLNRLKGRKYSFVALPAEEVLNDKQRLFITIDRFDSNQEGETTLQGHWSLKNLESGSTKISKIFNYKINSAIDLDSTIEAKSMLLERLSRDIASVM
jgi:uncharacterized lipoprotein YmbA